jgi:hypothetical protein
MAAPQGFEPRYADPESAVLPLNEGAMSGSLQFGVNHKQLVVRPNRSVYLPDHTGIGVSRSTQLASSPSVARDVSKW